MGSGRWDAGDWAAYSTTTLKSAKSVTDIYRSKRLNKTLDPKDVDIRESRDSEDNPLSRAIIVGLDVTGSMGPVLESMARTGLQALVEGIYDKKPVSDPHVMIMGIGDVICDESPLQITQFEADIRIAQQLEQLYLERGGGGNDCESYILPWYFANSHTSIDCFEKRGIKGFLFTVGDECPPSNLTSSQIERVLGYKPQFDEISAEDLFNAVSEKYEVYHLMVEQGSFYRANGNTVKDRWTKLIGQRAIPLSDHSKMGEVILSILQVNNGENKEDIVKSWDGTTAMVVERAIEGLVPKDDTDSGVILL